jgi:hypothetical protein
MSDKQTILDNAVANGDVPFVVAMQGDAQGVIGQVPRVMLLPARLRRPIRCTVSSR